MGPPPPSPRIEGQQHHSREREHYRGPQRTITAAASAAPLSSYASLASAPPPSFARKTSATPTAAVASNDPASAAGGTCGASASNISTNAATSATSSAAQYHHQAATSPRGSYPMSGGGGRTTSLLGAGRYDRGRGSSGGGRLGLRGSYRGGGRGGGGGRYQLSLSSSTSASNNTTSSDRFGEERYSSRNPELTLTRTGRGTRGGGATSVTTSDYGISSSRRSTSVAGRESSTARGGRGRGRDYMYSGGRASRGSGAGGRSYHRGGRGSNYRDDNAGRGGRFPESTYGSLAASTNNDNSYSSFGGGDNNSVGEITTPHPRSGSFSEDLPMEGPSPGEIRPSSFRERDRASNSSDGGRSVSPHPTGTTGGRRTGTYGSFSSATNEEFRRGGSQERGKSVEPGEQEESPHYAPGAKRRREDGEASEESSFVKRVAREQDGEGPPPLPFARDGTETSTASNNIERAGSDAGDEAYRNNAADSRLCDEGRWTSPPTDSPHATRRLYSSTGDNNFDDDSISSGYRGDSYGRGGRGRGRGRGYRGGRGGRGQASDYSNFGGRYGDRRVSLSGLSDGPSSARGPELSPRPSYASYSDLAISSATAAPSWRRHDDDAGSTGGPQPSPRGTTDWRKTAPPPPRIMVNSYATLAANPPPRPSPSAPSSPTKAPAAPVPAAEPERVEDPPPSPAAPSGYTKALARLADVEAQMEFAFAKHIMLVKRHRLLDAQYNHLESLPVGVDAFQAELDKLLGLGKEGETGEADEHAALYGS
ncbi:expressed unknown protein [Seminavis robusta]|uniref:Uncharacterized protein n=1 Tax=Seminavis robusta TaxID=568900 RepID=A0A9N8DKR5_9STRA|nr:expressed unknown protein [Seminavis robusta]|eukprot:Sro176_g077300.1 n/a (764) ;mRNA; r:24810-27101